MHKNTKGKMLDWVGVVLFGAAALLILWVVVDALLARLTAGGTL